ncbi:MAG: CDP-glycerol glycerophosphotransferase family protein [Sphingopyxis sp.]|uniref:CDP-glycerol glycerophosphotransferase family protein n=1 Tax=Sphingopyxis sp. TaxID=1908224 RepID=UPI002AB889DC|nr:CDP-glycerol glycerophosphotransferase family protein [Sphingopyxis sp.]MDZ3830284.1 CDP-glycerol glycerophosphotransferase family protein [Sphingopyxis sp.]
MRILFLFIGEPHQIFHSLPIAAEMASQGRNVEIAVASTDHLRMVQQVANVYPDFTPHVTLLGQRGPAQWLRAAGIIRNARLPLLIGALRFLREFDAIVVPERTTTAIRHFLPHRTKLIFTPHGAGDRAIMLDPRDRYFDFVLVAGEKSEKRLLEAGTIRRDHYAVSGYVKLDLMTRMQKRRAPLFDNDRPTVLYAPHFRRSLSSWDRFGHELIAWFAGQERYNLVVAPHIRLFAEANAAERASVERLAIPNRILIDLTSDRLFDMSYTTGADIYIGDVSSQVYEFLGTPRPCIFLNAHRSAWEGDPDYLFWTLGDVLDDLAELSPALDRAPMRHSDYIDLQRKRLRESIGGDPAGAAKRGGEAILRFLAKDSPDDKNAQT